MEKSGTMYKKLNLRLIAFLMAVMISAGGCSGGSGTESASTQTTTGETTTQTAAQITTQAKTEKQEEELKPRNNSGAKKTELSSGTFTIGQDIPPGRYVITGSGNGVVRIFEDDIAVINEKLGESGVPKVTADLRNDRIIEISDLDNATFTPAATRLSTVLSAGHWVVGLDIPAGRYEAACEEGKFGALLIYDNDVLVFSEVLDRAGGIANGVESVEVTLEKGQTVSIFRNSRVAFRNLEAGGQMNGLGMTVDELIKRFNDRAVVMGYEELKISLLKWNEEGFEAVFAPEKTSSGYVAEIDPLTQMITQVYLVGSDDVSGFANSAIILVLLIDEETDFEKRMEILKTLMDDMVDSPKITYNGIYYSSFFEINQNQKISTYIVIKKDKK